MSRKFLDKNETNLLLSDPARAAFNWRRRAEMLDATARLLSAGPARDGLREQAKRWREKAAKAELLACRLGTATKDAP